MLSGKDMTARALLGWILFHTALGCSDSDSSDCTTHTITSVTTYETTLPHPTTKTTSRPPHCTDSAVACPSADSCPGWTDWKTYKAKNGVNLGGWLEIEKVFYPEWWDSIAPDAVDEWTLCESLGEECSGVLEDHYATYITTSDIDKVADIGVEILRIPVTYAAFIEVPGSQLYHGSQLAYLREITEYAISQYDMRIILGLHSLPGGVNMLDIGEALGHDDWFHNQTNLDYSYQAVDAALDWIADSSKPEAFTFSPINEASDNIAGFGTPETLTSNGTVWVVEYARGVIDRVKKKLPCLPIMMQDCFMGEEHWSPYFGECDNVAIDVHIYYFAAAGIYSQYVSNAICGQAEGTVGDGKLPVFVGEWALQVLYNNSFAMREEIFNTQRYAWYEYLHGGTFWSIKHNSTAPVDGEGLQRDYWSYEGLIDEGVIKPWDDDVVYCE
ncbi:glycoside hydrolase superfamily [Aspergillus floccosus]